MSTFCNAQEVISEPSIIFSPRSSFEFFVIIRVFVNEELLTIIVHGTITIVPGTSTG